MDISAVLKNLVSITNFNQGHASKYFARVKNGESFVVMKNNSAVAVIVSPDEYMLLREIARNCRLSLESKEKNWQEKIKPLVEELQKVDGESEAVK